MMMAAARQGALGCVPYHAIIYHVQLCHTCHPYPVQYHHTHTIPYRTAPHYTAPHRTALHRTAPYHTTKGEHLLPHPILPSHPIPSHLISFHVPSHPPSSPLQVTLTACGVSRAPSRGESSSRQPHPAVFVYRRCSPGGVPKPHPIS